MDAEGDFVVVWRGDGSTGNDPEQSIQAQRYASDGSPVSLNFQINTYTTSAQAFPAVTFEENGGFIVVWASYGSGGSDSDGASIQARRFASDGAPMAEQFQVNSMTFFRQSDPAVAFGSDGAFVAVWQGSADPPPLRQHPAPALRLGRLLRRRGIPGQHLHPLHPVEP